MACGRVSGKECVTLNCTPTMDGGRLTEDPVKETQEA